MELKGKHVLVTGAGGFIGSHLAEKLTELGAKVRAMIHYNALGSFGWLDSSPYKDEMEIVAGDITDSESVSAAMQDISIVFHLGALIAIPYSYTAPRSYINTNVTGTLNVLQAARSLGTQRVLVTSTSEVYGSAQYVPIDEKHPLQGQSPYAASKIGSDKIAEAYQFSFGLPVVTVRPFNTFGPRQSARAVIPTIITQCLTKDYVKLGNLYPTRDLNYVSNTVDGYLAAAVHPDAVGKTFNFGSGREISIGDLAQLIADIVGKPIEIRTDQARERPESSEVDRLLADNTLAKEVLGWEPRFSLDQGLAETVDWLQENMRSYRPDEYTT